MKFAEIADRAKQFLKLINSNISVEFTETDKFTDGSVTLDAELLIFQEEGDKVPFTVAREIYIPGTYWQPPDSDICELDTYDNVDDAIKGAILLAVEDRINAFLEAEQENKLLDELEEAERLAEGS